MSVAKLSQSQRVLRLALSRGEDGICAVDFLLPDVVDGGRPITRLAARIKDLADDGIHFTDGGRRHGVKVYRLDRESLAKASLPPEPGVSGSSAAQSPSREGQGDDRPLTAAAGGPETPATQLFPVTFDEAVPPVRPRSAINDDVEAA